MEEAVKISALCAACILFVAPLRDFEGELAASCMECLGEFVRSRQPKFVTCWNIIVLNQTDLMSPETAPKRRIKKKGRREKGSFGRLLS